MSNFNPQEHLIKLKGKDYLQVQHRVQWFRSEHPTGSIVTELLDYKDDMAVVQATVSINIDGSNTLKTTLATGLAIASSQGAKTVWSGKEVMKAETAAIGRALAHAGFGTQFTGEDEGDFLADSPVENGKQPSKPKRKPSKKDGKASPKIDVTQEQEDDISWHPGFIDWTKNTMDDEWSMPNVLAALTVSLDLITCHKMADYPGDKARAKLAIGCWMIGYDDELVADMVADYFQSTRDKSPETYHEYLELACLNNQRYGKTESGKQKQADKEAMF